MNSVFPSGNRAGIKDAAGEAGNIDKVNGAARGGQDLAAGDIDNSAGENAITPVDTVSGNRDCPGIADAAEERGDRVDFDPGAAGDRAGITDAAGKGRNNAVITAEFDARAAARVDLSVITNTSAEARKRESAANFFTANENAVDAG